MARIPSFAGDVPFMSKLFQACFTIIMVTLVYVLVSSDNVCEGYKSSYHTAVSCCCMCMVHEKGQIGQIYDEIKSEICLAF